jgi:hypothetical protein
MHKTPTVLWAAVVLLVLAALLTAAAGLSLLVALVPLALAAAVALLRLARERPERAALLLAALAVGSGLIGAGARVADGVADSRVEYRGELSAAEIQRTFHPDGVSDRHGELRSADGIMRVRGADGAALALWSLRTLAPWLLAVIVLGLLAPLLRAAERDDPFRPGAAQRLTWIGSLLLLGVPGIALLGYVAGQAATGGTSFAAPVAEPSLTLSVTQILPGVLVLVLAGIFRRGAELREFERHTV